MRVLVERTCGLVERTCGLDVHQAVIVACLLVGKAAGKVHKEVRVLPARLPGCWRCATG